MVREIGCYVNRMAARLMNRILNADKVRDPNKFCKCRKCDTDKPETHFRFDRKEDNGLRYTCLLCEAYPKHVVASRIRNIENTLSMNEYYNIIKQECSYCEGERWTNELLKINGIDRFDNSKGYHIWNCVPCCFHCNRLKSDHAESILLKFSKNYPLMIEKRNLNLSTTSQHCSEQFSDKID